MRRHKERVWSLVPPANKVEEMRRRRTCEAGNHTRRWNGCGIPVSIVNPGSFQIRPWFSFFLKCSRSWHIFVAFVSVLTLKQCKPFIYLTSFEQIYCTTPLSLHGDTWTRRISFKYIRMWLRLILIMVAFIYSVALTFEMFTVLICCVVWFISIFALLLLYILDVICNRT